MKRWLAFMAAGTFWGSSFLWIKIALIELTPLTVVAYRLSLAVVGLFLVMQFTRAKFPRDTATWKHLIIISLLSPVIPFVLIVWGETRIESSLASILNGTMSLFTVFVAHFALHDEKLSARRLCGLIVGFLGVYVLVSGNNSIAHATTTVKHFPWGELAVLAASASYACSGVYAKKHVRGLNPIAQTASIFGSATIIIWILVLLFDRPVLIPHLAMTWISLTWMGLLGTCLAFLCYYYLLSQWGATRTSLVNYIMPVVGVILGIVFLHEPLQWNLAVGTLLVVTGIVLVNLRSLPNWISLASCKRLLAASPRLPHSDSIKRS